MKMEQLKLKEVVKQINKVKFINLSNKLNYYLIFIKNFKICFSIILFSL